MGFAGSDHHSTAASPLNGLLIQQTGRQLHHNVPTAGDLPISADDLVIVNALLKEGHPNGSQYLPHLSLADAIQTTDDSAKPTCDLTMAGKNGQPQPCGSGCISARALTDHKRVHRKRKPVDVESGR
ncbi:MULTISPECIES: hypothetical protein [unclassified Endozoicomonas]|uniref:hypothetical protein n=1 Tax=unclassified Endozoicomonas TaxID=2644528 RepID=UPI003BB72CC2